VSAMRALAALLAALPLSAVPALPVAAAEPVERPPDTARTRLLLADTMGAMHYLTIICSGRLLQDWRNRMSEMLSLESLADYQATDLIAAFNHGYRQQKRYYPECTAQNVSRIVAQKRYFAEQGKVLAATLADPYLH